LVDGAVYEWLLDTVTPADGIEGYGTIAYRHPAQLDFPGNSSVLIWDLQAGVPNQPWINVDYIDLAFVLTFSDGGVPNPVLTPIGSFPISISPVPEPSTMVLALAGCVAVWCARVRAAVCESIVQR
jgi:hypothetical protein